MPRRKARDLVPSHAGGFEQSEDARMILGTPDAQRDRGQVVGSHDAQRNTLEVRRIGLLHRLPRERTEHRRFKRG
jgi:hypothetical protein